MRDYSFVLNKINPTEKIYIAYSGGLDSSVLLDIFYKLSIKNSLLIEAIHVNHNINKESKIWEDHCMAELGPEIFYGNTPYVLYLLQSYFFIG